VTVHAAPARTPNHGLRANTIEKYAVNASAGNPNVRIISARRVHRLFMPDIFRDFDHNA